MKRTALAALVLFGAAFAGCDGGGDRLLVYLRQEGDALQSDEVVVAGLDGETVRTIDLPVEVERLIPTGYGDTLFAFGSEERLLFVDAGEGKAEKLELPDGMGIQSLFFDPRASAASLPYRLVASPVAGSVAVLDQATGEVIVVAENTREGFVGARLSEDAEHVAVLTSDELQVIRIDDPDKAITFEGPIGSPAFGRDERIAFIRNPGKPDAELAIAALEGSDETTIPVADRGVFWAAPLPGEDRVAMLGEAEGETQILSADADGDSVEVVGAYDGPASPPFFSSPEGGGLVFRDEDEDVWVWAGLGGHEPPRALTELPSGSQPSGPLTRWVSFTSQGGDVAVLDLESGDTNTILDQDSSFNVVQGFPGMGTADGRLAVALTQSEDGTDFWLLRLAESSAEKLASGNNLRGAALSSDGEVVAFVRAEGQDLAKRSIDVREVGGDRLATIENAMFPVIVDR